MRTPGETTDSAYLRQLLDSTAEGFYAVDRDGVTTLCNRAFVEMLGFDNEGQVVGRKLHDVIHHSFPDGRHYPKVECPIYRCAQFGEASHVANENFYRTDGTAFPVEYRANPIIVDGELRGAICTFVDVTEQRRMMRELEESEARQAAIAAATPECIKIVARDGSLLHMNNAGLHMIEADSLESVRNADTFSLIAAEHRDEWRQNHQRVLAGESVTWEFDIVSLNGTRRHMETHAVPLRLPDSSVAQLAVTRDVSGRKVAEGALRGAHDTLATLNRTGAAIAAELDLERVVQTVTDAGVELVGAAFGAFFYNVINDAGEALMLYTLSGAERSDFENFGMPRATAVFKPTFLGEGVIRSDDIMADARYGKSAPHHGMPHGHLPVRSYLAVPVASRSGEVIGGLFFGHPEQGRFTEAHEALIVGIAAQAAIAIDNARLYQAVQRELDERRRAEAALRTGDERLRIALAAGGLGDWSWNASTGLIELSADAATILDLPDVKTITWAEMQQKLLHPDDAPVTHAAVETARSSDGFYRAEYRSRMQDGGFKWLATHGRISFSPDGTANAFAGVIQDISERKRAEAELRELNESLERRVAAAIAEREQAEEALRQAQKMEAVGQLTGGLAHDFNNLLTVVTGNIDMAGRALVATGIEDARVRRALDSAMKGAERAAALTQRLLAFSRRQPLAPKALDVDKLVLGMSDMLNRSLGEMVKLEIVTAPGLWRVEADPNQLESSLLNLAVNARDAMPQGGNLVIETANARLDEDYSAAHAEVAPGLYVMIAVTDTGTGMPKKVQERVFEPFYTTKEVGKGTGLGLSMVYGFVKQSGGHVKIYSEEGEGTTIKIYLPRLMAETLSEQEAQLTPGLELSPSAETILVVEDDDDVRAYTVECLRDLGYRVLEAHDGTSALRLLERQEKPIELLFTDVVMPGMSGRELADAAREQQPLLKVLYTSGYTRNAIVHGGRLDAGVEMIAKPFTYAALAQKVRDVLDVGRTGRILVVESEPTVRALAVEALGGSGYLTDEAATAVEAMGKIRAAQGRFDAVFIDLGPADRTGDTVSEIRSLHLDLPILLAVGSHEANAAARFEGDRCTGTIGKPYTAARLTEALNALGLKCRCD